jgi:predicted negative regulator of RcsB-dependent stress response
MKKAFLGNCVFALIFVALFYVLYFNYPVQYVYAIDEDGWTEYATFVFYFMATVLLSILMLRHKEYRKPGYILLLLMTCGVALEEVSWGQRILGIGTPYRLSRINLQHEFNIHNIATVQSKSVYLKYYIFGWVFLAPLLCKVWKTIDALRIRFGVPLMPVYLWPFFIILIYLENDPVLFHRQEPFEVLLAFSFMALVCAIFMKAENLPGRYGGLKAFASILIIAASTMIVLLVHFFPWPDHLKFRFNQLAEVYQERGLYSQSETVFEYMIKNPHLLKNVTKMNYGKLLLESGNRDKGMSVLREEIRGFEKMVAEPGYDAIVYYWIGLIHTWMSDEEQAMVAFKKSLDKYETELNEADKDWEIVQILLNISNVYVELHAYNNALASLEHALLVTTDKKSIEDINGRIEQYMAVKDM